MAGKWCGVKERACMFCLILRWGDSKVTGMVKGMIQWDCKPDDDYRSGASLHGSTTQMKAGLNPQERFRLDTCILRQIFWLPQ